MEVRVELEVGGCPLHHEDGTALAVARIALASEPALVEPEHRAHEDPSDVREQVAVVGEPLPQLVREREHPLPKWNVRQNVIEQVARGLRHPAAETRRAEPTRFAAESDDTALGAALAGEDREASAEQAT